MLWRKKEDPRSQEKKECEEGTEGRAREASDNFFWFGNSLGNV